MYCMQIPFSFTYNNCIITEFYSSSNAELGY